MKGTWTGASVLDVKEQRKRRKKHVEQNDLTG